MPCASAVFPATCGTLCDVLCKLRLYYLLIGQFPVRRLPRPKRRRKAKSKATSDRWAVELAEAEARLGFLRGFRVEVQAFKGLGGFRVEGCGSTD